MDKAQNSVLIVDDENSNIMELAHILGTEYTVYAAKNGQRAIEAAEKYLPDIILLDILMPDMDGYAVLVALKNSEKTQNIPVIFVTGLNDTESEEKGLALGASDYIFKPFSPAIVKVRVRNQIRALNQMRLIIEKALAEKNSRSKMEFLLCMSHEMLSPMNSIMGIANILKTTGNVSGRMKEYLDEIDSASRSVLELIHNLLDASGKKDGAFGLSVSIFSFRAMLKNVLSGINHQAAKKHQALTADIDPSIPEWLLGDSEHLAQVMTNLLTNAIKFTPEYGTIHLTASVLNKEEGTGMFTLQIEIADTGIGMSKEQQGGIFNFFRQPDGTAARTYEGVGLGLLISKRIVEMMDGKIWVDSEPDKGSTFTFTCKMQEEQ